MSQFISAAQPQTSSPPHNLTSSPQHNLKLDLRRTRSLFTSPTQSHLISAAIAIAMIMPPHYEPTNFRILSAAASPIIGIFSFAQFNGFDLIILKVFDGI